MCKSGKILELRCGALCQQGCATECELQPPLRRRAIPWRWGGLLAGLLALAPALQQGAEASPVSYQFGVHYVVNPDASVFGTGASITLVFDNGSSSRLNQTYRLSDVVGITVASLGGLFYLGGSHPLSINVVGDGSSVMAGTDASGVLAMDFFVPGSGIEFFDSTSQTHAAVWAWSDWHQTWISEAISPVPNGPSIEAKGLFVMPEPGSASLLALALAAAAIGVRPQSGSPKSRARFIEPVC